MSKIIEKSTAKNVIGYTGIVTLSQYIRGKKFKVAEIHNAGGKPLFDYLADCLVGDFDIAKLDRPNKILLLNKDENDKLTRAADTGFIGMLTKPERVLSNDEGIVRYSFTIPQDIFAGTNFNAVGLYAGSATSTDVENYAAYCYIGDGILNNVSLSAVLVLDWELHISN